MCGLACTFAYGSKGPGVNKDELLKVRDTMYNRGPDSSGLWVSDDHRIGLAHRRLSILDISDAGSQPMLDEKTGNRIIFNGEIYNFKELRLSLQAQGHIFKSRSDTEVLLRLYSNYGQDMLGMLRGMFAFVIWDEEKKGIFAARDQFGIKPLYIADDGSTIRIASQVKALLAGGSINLTTEPAGHVGFFLWGYVPEPYTLYKGVRALPSGTSLWVDYDGEITYNEYFNLADEYKKGLSIGEEIYYQDPQNTLHQALLDSVRHHLITDVSIGVFLSSGLDSSTITNLAVESGERNLNTLTLGFKEFLNTDNDEVPLADMLSNHIGTHHHSHRINSQDFFDEHKNIIQSMDQPSIDGVNTYFICKAAKSEGLKVVLSGLGGDELFAGYSYFDTIPKITRFSKLFGHFPIFRNIFRSATMPLSGKYISPKITSLLEYGESYEGAYLLSRSFFMPWEISEFLGKDFFQEGWNDLRTLLALKKTFGTLKSERTIISALELQWYMKSQLLRDSDWASMAHSVELRVPFVDVDLFREISKLIGFGFAPSKLNMANACKKPLPQSLLNKPKTGFSIPVEKWLLGQSNAREEKDTNDLKLWSKMVHKAFN